MNNTIAQAEEGVHQAFAQALRCVEPSGPQNLFAVESSLWAALMALGRALLALFLARQAARPRATEYRHQGRRYVLDWERPRTTKVATRMGKVTFCRPVGRKVGRRNGACDLPVDREIGLVGRVSLGTMMALGRLCALLAFGTARATFLEFHLWRPSPRATLRIVDALGQSARPFLEQAPAPCDDGEVLVVQVDARGAPMIRSTELQRRRQPRRQKGDKTGRHHRRDMRKSRSRPRRKKGDKSKNAKGAFVGVVYTLRSTAQGLEGPVNKRIYATFASHEALFIWLRREADKRGYGTKRTLFLADGSEHIWRLQLRYFPLAEPCLDWYHAVEKLWKAGQCLHREGSPALCAFVEQHARWLRSGRVQRVLHSLQRALDKIAKTGPGNRGRRQRLHQVWAYLAEHRHRMPYAQFRREDLDIGTGCAEGAVRNAVALRLDGPGMRWGLDRAEFVLHLRCILLNQQWGEFTEFLQRVPPRMAAQPLPTRTHDAKPQHRRSAA